MNCKICSGEVSKVFSKKILNKYDVNYYQCKNCQFMQTEDPYWLDESYKSAINYSDIGVASRSLLFSENSTFLFSSNGFDRTKQYMDFGAGYGLYVRLMRDNGFNFYWQDDYCDNLFATQFTFNEIPKEKRRFEVITAFEVFEHLVNPIQEIEKMLTMTDSILFSTELTSNWKGDLETWWYIGPMHGQHIAFYHKNTLSYIANKYGLNLYTNKSMHFLTKRKISPFKYKLSTIYQVSRLYNTILTPKSLNQSDFESFQNSPLDAI